MEDEAEIYMGSRAEFPLTFGKRPKAQTPLAALHNATRRPANEPKLASVPAPAPAPASAFSSSSKSFVALSSSSKAWLDSLRSNTKPKTSDFSELEDQPSNSTSKISVLEGDGALVCSLRPTMSTGNQEEEDEAMDAKTGPQVYSSEDDDRAMIGPPPPPVDSVTEEEEEGMIGPPRPPEGLKMGDSEEDDEADDEEDENRYQIPMSNEIVLKGPSKVVSALAVDPTGSRVLSGSYDYTVHMYDFQGMNSKLASFRQLEPFEGHQVRALSWSPTAGFFLCVTGSAQAKIYDRDGLTIGEFMKGDMYIRDLKNTKGHISGITCGEWHPKTKETILTSSEDGSLRIWDVNDFKSQKQVIKPKLARPGRVPVTTCAWNRDGKCIAGGIGDGSIQIWNLKAGWGSRPDVHVENAHSDDITGLKFSSDGRHLLSRSFDSTLKVWDLRRMKLSLKEFEELPNHYAQTNIAFSPDEQLILTGTSVEKDSSAGGLLCFYDREKLELVSRVGISVGSSVVQCAWHPKLNQVFATAGNKSQGGTHILYDPTLSERGALVCVARAPRKKSVDDFEAKPVIHNPHALPLFRDQPSRKRQREKILKDPLKSHKPELPITGPGHGGRTGSTKGSLLTQYLLKQGGMLKETWMDEDPREAILKYADIAAKDPKFIAPAYSESQPKPVFAESESEEEE